MAEVDDLVAMHMVDVEHIDLGDKQDLAGSQGQREAIEDEDHSVEDIEEHTVGDINLGLST